VLALFLALSCDRPAGTETNQRAAEVTEQVRVFLIAPQDGGVLGQRVGCGDSAVPVEVKLPRAEPALYGALHALLGKRSRNDQASGYYNALYASPLELQRIERVGGEARIHLTGYLEVGDSCDGQRALAQLTETALQFQDVQRVQLWLDGKPLRDLLFKTGKTGGT
jgi:hypothetical protein